MLEKTLESPLDSKEIKPVNPKGNEPWIFLGRTDAEAETLILWPLDLESWHIGKDPDAGKDWGQEKKGMTEDDMAGWYHQLNEHEFEQAQGDGEGKWSLASCSPCRIPAKSWTRLNIWTTITSRYWLNQRIIEKYKDVSRSFLTLEVSYPQSLKINFLISSEKF